MARKEMITIDRILDTAFAMTREEGFANVTARKVAAKAGCSTQPIFRVYKNMEELWDAVYERATAYFLDYYSLYPRTGKTPFSNLGMAYIVFAREERHLFELLFVSGDQGSKHKTKSMYEILNGDAGNVVLVQLFKNFCLCRVIKRDAAIWIPGNRILTSLAVMTASGDPEHDAQAVSVQHIVFRYIMVSHSFHSYWT